MRKIGSKSTTVATIEEGFTVQVRDRLTHGEMQEVQTELKKATLEERNTDWVLIKRYIVAWSITDDDGNPLPVSEETLSLMDHIDVLKIAKILEIQIKGLGEEVKNVLGSV